MPYFYDNHVYFIDSDLKDLQKTVDCHIPQQIDLTQIDLPLKRESKLSVVPLRTE